jgi:hypothetical protein
MMHRLLVILGILSCPALLHAETPPAPPANDGAAPPQTVASSDRWYARPFAIEGHLGVGAPLGLAGAAFDYSPSRWFGAGAGVGVGAAGVQTAAMARLRIPLAEGVGIGVGGGLSGGNYEWVEGGVFSVFIDKPASRMWKPAYWANADVEIEGRFEGGFTLRGYIGRAALLNPSDGACGAGSASEVQHCQTFHPVGGGFGLGYAGIAMGYAFSR